MKFNKILTTTIIAAGIVGTSMVGCYEGELYYNDAPEWMTDSIKAVADRKAANSGSEEEDAPGFVVDLAKYGDLFEFRGKASMVNKEVVMIDNSAGGKNGSFVILKQENEGWLEDKISFKDVATVSFDAYPTVNGSDWNYIFGLGYTASSSNPYHYIDGTIGFIHRLGDPYNAFFPGESWASENKLGGSATENPYNYFSGLDESNCNKWYHFDYIYSTSGLYIYVNGVRTIVHENLTDDQVAAVKDVLSYLNKGLIVIGAGCDPNLENFGGYIANFTLRNIEFVKTSNFYSGEVTPKESEIKALTIEGPETVPFGTTYEKLLEQVKITVAYEIDGETREQELTTSDVIATLIPDMSTVGKKTLSVYYNTTYAGNFQENVKAELEFEVQAPAISAIKVKTDLSSVDYFTGADPTKLCELVVVGVKDDASEIALDNATLTISAVDGDGKFNVSYKLPDGTELTTDGQFKGSKLDVSKEISVSTDGTIIGAGEFVDDAKFGKVYKNNTNNTDIRTNYLTLPTDVFNECKKTGILTVSFWIKNYGKAVISEWSPVFMIKNGDVNSEWAYYIFRHKGQLLVNYAGYVDSPLAEDWSAENDWLNGNDDWHYVVATIAKDDLTLYVDGEILSTCTPNGGDANNTNGFIDGLGDINFFALGGAQTNGWGDPDLPCLYSDVTISNTAPTAEEVKAAYEAKK